MGQHTPTPWYSGGPMDFDNYIVQTHKGAVAHVHPPQAEANAEFIVRAVNSHEELLEAAKRVMSVLEREHEKAVITSDLQRLEKNYEDFIALREAIAKAEGGES